MGKLQQVNIFTSIFKIIVNREAKVNNNIQSIGKCANCKQEIDNDDVYLRFSGEFMHTDCLVDYLQKLRILDVVIPSPDYDPCDALKKRVQALVGNGLDRC